MVTAKSEISKVIPLSQSIDMPSFETEWKNNPHNESTKRWDNKQVTATLEKAWHYARIVVDKDVYRQVSEYVRGGEPIDLITIFNLGVNIRNYCNEIRRCVQAMVMLVAAIDALDLGNKGRAFECLEHAKSLVSIVDKKAKAQRVRV